MVTVAIRALELEYLAKVLDWGWSRSRYILPTPTPPKNSFRLRLHLKFLPTPTPPKNSFRLRLHLKIPSDSDSTKNSFRLRLHQKFLPTPTPPKNSFHLLRSPAWNTARVSRLMYTDTDFYCVLYTQFYVLYKYFMYNLLDFIHYSILSYFNFNRIVVCERLRKQWVYDLPLKNRVHAALIIGR
jgi:hypothetical protein